MTIYYLILIFTTALVKLNTNIKVMIGKKRFEIFFILSVFIILFFAVNRSTSIGKDTFYYGQYFEQAINMDIFDLPYEIGFNIFTKIFQFFSTNFNLYLSFISLITLIPIMLILKYESKELFWITIYIFIATQYVSTFSILRAYVSISFILIAYHLKIKNSRNLMFWILCILSISFHYSSIIYLIFILFGKVKFKRITYLFVILAATIFRLPLIATKIRYLIISLLNFIRPNYSLFTLDFETDISIMYVTIYGIISLLCLIYFKNKKFQGGETIVLMNMAFFMLIFNLSMTWFPAYSRISSASLIFMSLLIPRIILSEKSPAVRLVLKLGFCLLFLIYLKVNLTELSIYEFR